MRVRRSFMLVLLPALAGAEPPGEDVAEGERLFEAHCGVCHSLDLPRSQQLDRTNWEWVMEDMVEKFGCTWLTPEQQDLILDYLVIAHGPED